MPELKDVPEIAKLLAIILTAEPVTHGALAVVPLLAPNLDDPDWLTLEEAGDRARVTEVSEGGSRGWCCRSSRLNGPALDNYFRSRRALPAITVTVAIVPFFLILNTCISTHLTSFTNRRMVAFRPFFLISSSTRSENDSATKTS